jgi:hypothetical protein
MVPVAAALAGSGLDRATTALVAWFGPRGLASVVFCLLALEELGSQAAHHAAAVISFTVVLSVVVHGATADPLAGRYAGHLARHPGHSADPDLPGIPERRLTRRAATPQLDHAQSIRGRGILTRRNRQGPCHMINGIPDQAVLGGRRHLRRLRPLRA